MQPALTFSAEKINKNLTHAAKESSPGNLFGDILVPAHLKANWKIPDLQIQPKPHGSRRGGGCFGQGTRQAETCSCA